jgi:hypothetical protein
MDGVEIVVHGDPTHAHRIGDVLDGSAEDERTPFVEESDRTLFVFPRQARQRSTQLGFDRVDQSVEGAVERRHAYPGDDDTVPDEGDVGGIEVAWVDERRSDRRDQWFDGRDEGMLRDPSPCHRPDPRSSSVPIRVTSTLT